jgi:transcriptional regulator with XRE-family HTH domain
MTQRELADRAGVSIDLISKLEQGRRHSALVGNLHRIAHALDVELSTLLGKPSRLEATEDTDAGIVAIRQALTSPFMDEPASPQDLKREVAYSWGAYWNGHYDELGRILPPLLMYARVSDDHALLSEVYQVTGCMLVHLAQTDLSFIALERALAEAKRSDDVLRYASLSGSLAWLLLNQGRMGESQRVAANTAEEIEPSFDNAEPQHLSVWGSLLLTAATAAGRSGKADTADDFLSMASVAADKIGADRNDYQTAFGPSQAVMQSVDVAIVTGRFARALKLAASMPVKPGLPTAAYARHLTDLSYSLTELGRSDQATQTLLRVERLAPEWMRYQAFPKAIVRELRERAVRTSAVHALAARLGV